MRSRTFQRDAAAAEVAVRQDEEGSESEVGVPEMVVVKKRRTGGVGMGPGVAPVRRRGVKTRVVGGVRARVGSVDVSRAGSRAGSRVGSEDVGNRLQVR